ncbi:MAG TPA: hypothetical protein VHU15_05205, partial [Stellaceae bacterium]|nr:hypothetical protein [Stellaceae bacterium]
MSAQLARFGITLLGMIAAGAAFWCLGSGWDWLAAIGIFFAAGAVADVAFRRLASKETIREDLEDRVR